MTYHLIYEDSVNSGIGHLVRMNALFTELCKLVGPHVSMKPLDQQNFVKKGMQNFDTVVYDTLNEPDLREIHKLKSKCVCIDPPYMLSQIWDGVIFPHLHTTEARMENAENHSKSGILSGPGSIIMSPKVLGRKIIPPKKRRKQVVFSAGGQDYDDSLSKMHALTEGVKTFTSRIFMKGSMYEGALSKSSSKEVAYWDVSFMQTSRIAVTMMGISVYEYLKLGTPVMVFPRTEFDEEALLVLQENHGNMVTPLPRIDEADKDELCLLIKHRIDTLSNNFNNVEELRSWVDTAIGNNGGGNVTKYLYLIGSK